MSRYNPQDIHCEFGERLELLSDEQAAKLCRALQPLPDEVVESMTKNILPVSSNDLRWAFWLSSEDLKKIAPKGFVLLSADLWNEGQGKIEDIVAHEIAHILLGHKSPLLNYPAEEQEKREEDMEREANKLASEWLGRKVQIQEDSR